MIGIKINKLLKPLGIQILKVKKRDSFRKTVSFEVNNPIEHNSESRMNEFYSDETRIDVYVENRLDFYKKLPTLLDFKKEGIRTVVDVGCGTGHLLLYLRKIYPNAKFYGLEYSEEAIHRAQKYFPEAQYQIYDIYDRFNKSFDVVFCTEVIEHLLYPNKALQNLLAMIDEDGRLIITVPEGRKDSYLGHINFWSPESWRVFIEQNLGDLFYAEFELLEINNNVYNFALIKRKK